MTQAILAYTSDNILTRNVSQRNRLFLHRTLQFIAAGCIATAFICVFIFKSNMNRDHFETTHSFLGLLTCLFSLAALGGGLLAAEGVRLRHLIKPVILKIGHATFGVISYSMAVVTIFYGLNSAWMHENFSQLWINVLVGIVACVWVYAVVKPLMTVFKRIEGLTRPTE